MKAGDACSRLAVSRRGGPRFTRAETATQRRCYTAWIPRPRDIKLAYLCFAVTAAFLSEALGAQTETIAQANQEYRAGRFTEAIPLYERAIEAGETTAPVFYNLGNAHFRAGDRGKAILNYERALVLKPEHPEAAANLRLARDQARTLVLRTSWWERITERVAANQLTVGASVAFWLAAFVLGGLLFARRRSPLLITGFVMLVALFGGMAAALYIFDTKHRDRAVVIARNIEARLATAENAGSVLALPPGTEIKILSTRGEWTYAALPNDLRGWIPARSAERVRL